MQMLEKSRMVFAAKSAAAPDAAQQRACNIDLDLLVVGTDLIIPQRPWLLRLKPAHRNGASVVLRPAGGHRPDRQVAGHGAAAGLLARVSDPIRAP